MCKFLNRLKELAENADDKRVLHWIDEKGKEEASLTSSQIWTRSGAVADKILKYAKPGDRVMIVYPFGLEFVIGLIACMRAGVIPVSVYPPNPAAFKKDIVKFNKYYEDCGATLAVTTGRYYMLAKAYSMTNFFNNATWPKNMEWISTDFACDARYIRLIPDSNPTSEDIAFIQYTSGSTGDPKGVTVSYGALEANLDGTKAVLGIEQQKTVGVLWLPQYHDLGLVGGFLCTIYEGCTTYFFSPLHFISNPLLWAELIQRYNATNIAAPTFAYGLLAKRIRQSGRTFDFSSLSNAIVSAEPIRASVLRDMKEIGIPAQAIDQAYGAAESVAFIASGGRGVDNGIPSCGNLAQSAKFGKHIIVLDEKLESVVAEGVVGNVLLTGPDLCSGYWKKPTLNKEVFNLEIPGVEGKWYKTGDLGYVKEGQLYLTGRKKDVIIIQGRNFFPQDLEWAAEEQARGSLRPGCVAAGQLDPSAAFLVGEMVPGKESLTLAEAAQMARKVSVETNVPIRKVILLKKNCLPKTTSGKIRRAATREAVLHGGFQAAEVVLEWTAAEDESPCALEQPAVAIIGAGPAGMVAAYALVKRGYHRVTVMEREPHVGGRSVGFQGYDEIYIGSGAYRAIAALAKEFEVDLGHEVAGDAAIPAPVTMPRSDQAPECGIDDTMVLELWAKAGYGLASEMTPQHYTLGPFEEVAVHLPFGGGVAMQVHNYPPHFFQSLWSNMQSWLQDHGVEFLLGHSVKTLSGTTVDSRFFDKVIMTVMPQDAWELTHEPMLQCFKTNRYGMVVFDGAGLAQDSYSFMAPHHDPKFVGHPLEIYKKSGVWYALVYAQLADSGQPAVSTQDIVANVGVQVEKLGGVLLSVLSVKIWDFFPHAAADDINRGCFERWESHMQGRGGVYWTGAFLGFDLTETVSRHAKAMVDTYFPAQTASKSQDDDDMTAMITLEESARWFTKLTTEVYPLFPQGPTQLFTKYYQFKGREGVYQSGMWMMDAYGEVEVNPDVTAIPPELLEGFFGASIGHTFAAKLRWIEAPDPVDAVPFKRCPTMYVQFGGSTFGSVGGLRGIFPHTTKMAYHLNKSIAEGDKAGIDRIMSQILPWMREEECAKSTAAHLFEPVYYGTGGGDLFRKDQYVCALRFIPRRQFSVPPIDFMADSAAVLMENEVEYDIMLQFGPWRECGFYTEDGVFDVTKCSKIFLNWDAKYPLHRLGRLRVFKQDVTKVDFDAVQAWDVGISHISKELPWEQSYCDDKCIDAFNAPLQPLSTQEFQKLSDGRIDVKNTLLAKVRQMLGIQEVDVNESTLQLGMSSFQLVQLAKFVQATYKADFPVTLFFDLATLGDVVSYIEAQSSGHQYAPERLVKHCSMRGGNIVDFAQPSLWCFPPIIGSGVYRTLSKHLPPDFELCELVDLSFYANSLEEETIQSLAQRYADAIRSLQPQGPYALGGFSFGSILAHAVSHCLGAEVSCVVMLDGIAPSARSTTIKNFTAAAHVNQFIHRQLRSGASYKATKSPARQVVVVVAEDQSFYAGTEVDGKETLGWQCIEPQLVAHCVPGSHLTIMREPNVCAVAHIVSHHARPLQSPRRPSLFLTGDSAVFHRILTAASQRRRSSTLRGGASPHSVRLASPSARAAGSRGVGSLPALRGLELEASLASPSASSVLSVEGKCEEQQQAEGARRANIDLGDCVRG